MTSRRAFLWASAVAAAATSNAFAVQKGAIGISMPTKASTRWISDGNRLVKALTDRDFKADLQYADNDVAMQLTQIGKMIDAEVQLLVISPVDGNSLSATLQRAAQQGIKVIAYDRLIRGTKNVDYYVSFDNFQVGVLQANAIVGKLGLAPPSSQTPTPTPTPTPTGASFNIEVFGGSPDDNNAYFFYNGAMSVLDPYIESGRLVVRSKQTGMNQVGVLRWDGNTARVRMEELLKAHYREARIDAVLSPYDGLSIGIIEALKQAGYGSVKKPFPAVSGQDAEVASVKSMLRGEQSSTVFKDTRELAKVAVEMIEAILAGKPPRITDVTTYNNGIKVVPSCLLKPVSVDKSNWRRVLIDSGYYSLAQLE